MMSQQNLIRSILDKYRIVANPNINDASLNDIINDNGCNSKRYQIYKNSNHKSSDIIQLLRLSELMKYYNTDRIHRSNTYDDIAIFGIVPSTKLMRVIPTKNNNPSDEATPVTYKEAYMVYLTDLEYEHTMIKLVICDSALKSVIHYKSRIEAMCLLITCPSSIHINSQGLFVIHVDKQNQLTAVGKCSTYQLCGAMKKNSSECCKMPVNAHQFTSCKYHSTRPIVVHSADHTIKGDDVVTSKVCSSNTTTNINTTHNTIDSIVPYVAIAMKKRKLPFPPSDDSIIYRDDRPSTITANIDTSRELPMNTTECITVEEQREDMAFDLRHHKDYIRRLMGPGYEHREGMDRDNMIDLLDPIELSMMKKIITHNAKMNRSSSSSDVHQTTNRNSSRDSDIVYIKWDSRH